MPIDPSDIALCVADDEWHLPAPGDEPGRHAGRPMSAPVVHTSLYAYPDLASLGEALGAEHLNRVYARGRNPTVDTAARRIAALERGEAALCFASGMAAISAVMLGTLQAGDHILFVNQTYGPTLQLARHLRRFGVEHDLALELDVEAVENAILPNTRLIWLESPGTMLFRVLDLRGVATLARERGILTCIDNSWATPLLQKPLTLGLDLVVHTATKYLGGHSDLVAGAVVSTAERIERLFYRALLLNGGILGPSEAWLLLRGMRTLPVRLHQHGEDGLAVARFLREHPAVRRVFHPAFDERSDLVESQLRGYSGLLSFELEGGGFESVRTVIDALRIPRIGVSWGGVESLVISPNRGTNQESLAAYGIPPGLIRLSVGLEGAEALIDDLDQALASVF